MTRRCFLHVGAAKTGSTSIQEALFNHLRDCRFQYVAGGWANGSFAISSVFEPSPENQWTFHAIGRTGTFAEYQAAFARQLHRGFARSRRHRTDVIISAESVWMSSREGQTNLLRRLEDEQLDIRVIAYLRPWVPWINSMFQEAVKGGRSRLVLGQSREGAILRVRDRLQNLFAVYGRDRVSVSLFDPDRFPQGCVVRDFCRQVGFPVPAGRQWRTNESLSLEGLRLLVAFNRHAGPVGEWSRPRPEGYLRLVSRLQALRGPRVELHPRFLEPWLAERRRDDDWIEAEVGLSLSEHPPEHDADHAIATEADLWRYSEQTRDWLARQVGGRMVRLAEGEAAARAIASQVDLLRLRSCSLAEKVDDLSLRARYWWVQRTAGC